MRFFKFVIFLLLVPAAAGITIFVYNFFLKAYLSCLMFFTGVLLYTLIYPVFKKPMRAYVLGHELTHILGIWLFHGKIHEVKISGRGGMVRADKSNVWIRLLPYFFPIYTILVLGLYLLFSLGWDISRYFSIMVFALGITWGFHLWMTIHILWQNQPDIKQSGILFSLIIIYILNLLILAGLFVFISPELGVIDFFKGVWQEINDSYLWTLQKLI